jgi:citrate synthase
LLRDGELPSVNELEDFQRVVHERYEVKRDIRHMMWALPANGHPMDVLQTALLLERLLNLEYIQS